MPVSILFAEDDDGIRNIVVRMSQKKDLLLKPSITVRVRLRRSRKCYILYYWISECQLKPD